MKRMIFILLAFMLLSGGVASAQRQTAGRFSVEAYGGFGKWFTCTDGLLHILPMAYFPEFNYTGSGIGLSLYDYSGRFVGGFDFLRQERDFVEVAIYDKDYNLLAPEEKHYLQSYAATLTFGYLYRLWALRSRALSVSAGGSLMIGPSVCEGLGEYYQSPTSSTKNPVVGFYLGLCPEFQIEAFPLVNVSAFVSFKPHVCVVDTLAGSIDWFLLQGVVGLKYYL